MSRVVRCAIYTRKSSEEGLEQDFNSLDAQREACAAYVLSQASEGWQLLPATYDDAGLSGGTLERPALQRLLEDVREHRIDIIVVYKVDRLTRSLLDFAKLVESFDAAGVSFVSVTQSFNTTTSMGRLTLNMLLSFAQFEREVTAERIRDKIAASKAKGMWMGGTPPLGYRPDGRSLAIVEEHAALVRDIVARYLRLGTVRRVTEELAAEGIGVPVRRRQSGAAYGGGPFMRGQIHAILSNPVYAGFIAHKGRTSPGLHPAIIPHDQWQQVQQQLASHVQGARSTRQRSASILAGLLFDASGEPLVPVHAVKRQQRYRYYVRRSDQHGTGDADRPSLRIPAREIEQVVLGELDRLLADPVALLEQSPCDLSPEVLREVARHCRELRQQLSATGSPPLRSLLDRVNIHPERIVLHLSLQGLSAIPQLSTTNQPSLVIDIPVRLTRTGRAVRLIDGVGLPATATADPGLVRLLVQAHRWWKELATGSCDISTLSQREQVTASWMTRVVRLAFLSPEVTEALLAGKLRAGIDARTLLATGAIPTDWAGQRARLMAVR